MPNTTTFNMIPCILSGWVVFPAMGYVPLCCVLLLGQALCSYALAPGPNWGGIYPPTLPGGGFKAAGQCKLGFPGPARLLLLLHSRECQRLLELPVLPDEAAAVSKGLRLWSWLHKDPPPEVRARCVCLMRDTVQVFAFTQAGVWRPPNKNISH